MPVNTAVFTACCSVTFSFHVDDDAINQQLHYPSELSMPVQVSLEADLCTVLIRINSLFGDIYIYIYQNAVRTMPLLIF